MKRIIKELLFNGADRQIKAKFNMSMIMDCGKTDDYQNLTALEFLQEFQKELPEDEFKSL